jgi:hypothetical protein
MDCNKDKPTTEEAGGARRAMIVHKYYRTQNNWRMYKTDA